MATKLDTLLEADGDGVEMLVDRVWHVDGQGGTWVLHWLSRQNEGVDALTLLALG